tara:strand:- start:193 stop:372 length:180 start_codon:yes stop_codon:yes gene_type:complete
MKRIKMTALYKRINGLNQKWTDASMSKKAKKQEEEMLIKGPVIVDGQVWDVGQKKREEK